MKITKFENSDTLAQAVSTYLLNLIQKKPTATLVLTSGDTPVKAYKLLSQQATIADFEQVQIIGLDEWVGIGPESEGSCRYIVEENLLKPLGVKESNYTFFDALNPDLQSECHRIDALIKNRGGLDFILVGVGLNGHIGLNEPGVSFENYCHVSKLAPITIEVGQKYFKNATPLTHGVTVGLKHLLEAKTAMLIASGDMKASIIQKTAFDPISIDIPATVFRLHPQGLVWVDDSAGREVFEG